MIIIIYMKKVITIRSSIINILENYRIRKILDLMIKKMNKNKLKKS